jgi:hypothetical protein
MTVFDQGAGPPAPGRQGGARSRYQSSNGKGGNAASRDAGEREPDSCRSVAFR